MKLKLRYGSVVRTLETNDSMTLGEVRLICSRIFNCAIGKLLAKGTQLTGDYPLNKYNLDEKTTIIVTAITSKLEARSNIRIVHVELDREYGFTVMNTTTVSEVAKFMCDRMNIKPEFQMGFFSNGLFMNVNHTIIDNDLEFTDGKFVIYYVPILRYTTATVKMPSNNGWEAVGASRPVSNEEQVMLNTANAQKLIDAYYERKAARQEDNAKKGFMGLKKGFLCGAKKEPASNVKPTEDQIKTLIDERYKKEKGKTINETKETNSDEIKQCQHIDCKKRVGLLDRSLKCKCGKVFCMAHRHFTLHNCSA